MGGRNISWEILRLCNPCIEKPVTFWNARLFMERRRLKPYIINVKCDAREDIDPALAQADFAGGAIDGGEAD